MNFRKELVCLDFDDGLVCDGYKNMGSLGNLEERIKSFDNIMVEFFWNRR